MSVAVLVLLALTAATGLLLTARGPDRPSPGAAAMALLLAASASCAWAAGESSDAVAATAAVLAVLAAVAGGGPVATGVLHAADPAAVGVSGGPQDPDILRGGAWIGALERAAITGTLLVGWPEGLAVVFAVKGLGRFSELRASSAASERFIVGTLASALWAAACAGVAVLLRG